MKSNNRFILFLVIFSLAGCGGGGPSNYAPNNAGGGSNSGLSGSPGSSAATQNALAITVSDPLYPNKPTVSITVCEPGTANCQTVDNVLLDTGSFGLRIFKQAMTGISLPQVAVGNVPVAECVAYADGSGDWGPLRSADIVLGGETASSVPVQVIDAGYFNGAIPVQCQSPNVVSLDRDPASAGINGILGVGLFAQDCGQGCADKVNNGLYFTCSGTSCSPAAVPLSSQVQNPVVLLKQDNNGVIVQFPSVPMGGKPAVGGQLILGIGTRQNNTPSGVKAYAADANGEFSTAFNGTTQTSFIDSGSNGLFFSDSSLPLCSSPNEGWYCVQPVQALSAVNAGYTGSPGGAVTFSIGDAASLFQNPANSAFVELGGSMPGGGFDWGLPFFFGRTVVVGIEGAGSVLGTGPYWAY
ncbi:MAG TPA: DUF3443 domain-containing protein [Geobacteraceae bacterium]